MPAFSSSDDGRAAIDPSLDGWNSEVASESVDAQLARLARLLEEPSSRPPRNLFSDSVTATPLAPRELRGRYRDTAITVQEEVGSRRDGVQGVDAVLGELAALAGALAPDSGKAKKKVKFKLYRIDLRGDLLRTEAYLEAASKRASGGGALRQLNAVFTCTWRFPDGDVTRPPLLEAIEARDLRVAETAAPMFVDVTAAALGGNVSYEDQLLQSPDHWIGRITKGLGFNKFGWQGVSVADVDGDGLEDVFFPEQGGLPNKLFVQRPDGTFEDRSAASGLDFLERSLAGLFVDLDNDGDPDLVLSHRPAVLVLENDGTGRFETVRFVADGAADSHSLSAADYDLDGDLDLYVCAYRRAPRERGIASPVPFHDANNGGANLLLRNEGGFRFTDVTAEVGLASSTRFSLAASWDDFDQDGDPDLYVANDYGRNNLYRNDAAQGGGGSQPIRFTDVAAEAGVEDISSGMSVSWGDFNRDGWSDVYVGNMFSAAGNRITYQRRFEQTRAQAGALTDIQRMARGNSLFAQRGDGAAFVDASLQAGVNMGRWAWSSIFADVNNDGWEDLVVANGHLSQKRIDDL